MATPTPPQTPSTPPEPRGYTPGKTPTRPPMNCAHVQAVADELNAKADASTDPHVKQMYQETAKAIMAFTGCANWIPGPGE